MPTEKPLDDWSESDLGVQLVSSSARLSRLYGRVLGQLDPPLTYRQHRLLRRVGEGHASMAVLAARGNLSIPTVSESVDGLVRRGLLDRRTNPQNRRQAVLSLTPTGSTAVVAGDAALAALNERLLVGLPDRHRQELSAALTTIYDAATEAFRQLDGSSAPATAASRTDG